MTNKMKVYVENLLQDEQFSLKLKKVDYFINNKLPDYIMRGIYLFCLLVGCYLIPPIVGISIIESLIPFLPEKTINIILSENLRIISGGIFLGIISFPIFYKKMTFDILGEPKFRESKSLRPLNISCQHNK